VGLEHFGADDAEHGVRITDLILPLKFPIDILSFHVARYFLSLEYSFLRLNKPVL